MTRTSWLLCALAPLVAGGSGRAAAQGPAGQLAAPPPAAEPTGAGPGTNLVMLPTVAAALGASWTLAPAAPTSLVVDVAVGAAIGWPGGVRSAPRGYAEAPPQNEERYLRAALWLQPELGYSYQRGDEGAPRSRGHLGSLGLGVGYGSLLFATVTYTPRLVVGALGDELAVGLRHGVAAHFLGRLFAVEVAHQMLWTGDELRHELRLVLGLNAGALLLGWL